MKSIKLQTAFSMWLLAVIASGCKQETLNKPLTNNTNAPGVVSNVQVENKNGLGCFNLRTAWRWRPFLCKSGLRNIARQIARGNCIALLQYFNR
jgi:hypothetical protein